MDKETGDTQDTQEKLSEAQQKMVNKLMGDLRIEVREKTLADAKAEQDQATADAERKELAASAEFEKLAKMHSDRVTELEPYEAEAKAYRKLIVGMLKDQVKEMGDAAKKAVASLPESMTDLDRLNWLNANQELFEIEPRKVPGTPAAKVKRQSGGKSGRPEGYVPSRL